MSSRGIGIALLLVFACIQLKGFAGEPGWEAGRAKTNITPKQFMWMSGYASRNKPADSKLTDLWAKVLVLKDRQGKQVVLITLDLIGIGRKISKDICTDLQKQYGLNRDQIAICSSHTHTGPALADNLMPLHYLVVDKDQQQLIEDYSKLLRISVVETVGKALKEMKPSQVRWGNGKASFAVNRRNNQEAKVPALRRENKLVGPVDHDVPVLTVTADGLSHPDTVVFGYACHATVLSTYQWSGDYPGFAQIELEKAITGCQAMFWAGCGADQNPLPRRKVELAKKYGKELAEAVQNVIKTKLPLIPPNLKSSYHEIQLPLSTLPTREQIEKDANSKNRFVQARAKFLLSQIENNGKLETTYPYPVQTWRIGQKINYVFLGGEVVVDFAIRLKSEGNDKRTCVAGYSNDVMAYIASRRVLREGGYEGGGAMVYYGLPAPWAMESEDMIVDEVQKQLSALKEKD